MGIKHFRDLVSLENKELCCVKSNWASRQATSHHLAADYFPITSSGGVINHYRGIFILNASMSSSMILEKEHSRSRESGKAKGGVKRKREMSGTGSQQQEEDEEEDEDELQPEVEIDPELDRELENKSRQHNLTSANVRSIIHVSVDSSHSVPPNVTYIHVTSV